MREIISLRQLKPGPRRNESVVDAVHAIDGRAVWRRFLGGVILAGKEERLEDGVGVFEVVVDDVDQERYVHEVFYQCSRG